MSFKTEVLLLVLSKRINDRLDHIHDEAIRGFRSLARSVGQRTRMDLVRRSAPTGETGPEKASTIRSN